LTKIRVDYYLLRNHLLIKRPNNGSSKCFIKTGILILQVGLYQETVVSYEVVLSDGSCVTATADNEHSDLYRCLPWSHGTLGKVNIKKGF